MFNIFRKKINTKSIKTFEEAMDVSNFYIEQKKWDMAENLLSKLFLNEKQNYKKEIDNLDGSNESKKEILKENILKSFNVHIEKINNLKIKLSKDRNKYKFIPESIKKYSDAIKSIKTLTLLKEWDKAKKVIEEIKKSEKLALANLLDIIENNWNEVIVESEKRKQLNIFKKKEIQLNKLLEKNINLETKYYKKIEKEKFKIRFKKIKKEIDFFSKTWKNIEALNILKHFLKDNNSNEMIIKFYNIQKAKILKRLENNKKQEEEKIKQNTQLEALKLAWQTIVIKEDVKEDKADNFIVKIKNKFSFYKRIKEKIKNKKLLDEVTLLINQNEIVNKEIAVNKLANIHKWLVKELITNSMSWFDLYWKILWVNKISGDTFWLNESKDKYTLYLWDATGHWIKAWLIITLLTKIFNKYVKRKKLDELAFEINNWLKQNLQSRNFITGVLFEIEKNNKNVLNYVWMWHEPMLVFRKKTNVLEKIIPWGLAAWIRMIKDKSHIKIKTINLEDWDVVLTFSDGSIESKNNDWEFYGFENLKKSFLQACQSEVLSHRIYSRLIDDLIQFRWGSSFDDDTTFLLLKKDEKSEIQDYKSTFLQNVVKEEKISSKYKSRLIWKNQKEIKEEINKIKKEKQLNIIILWLKKLYQVWEFLKLKQECIRYIKEWWVHKNINFYLKKAIDNELQYKIDLKNKKILNRYNVLKELYKKQDYNTVINELEDIINKDGNI